RFLAHKLIHFRLSDKQICCQRQSLLPDPATADPYSVDTSTVANVFQRVGVQYKQVGVVSGFQRTDPFQAEAPGGVTCCGEEDLPWGHPRVGHEFHLDVFEVSLESRRHAAVGTEGDGDVIVGEDFQVA